LGPSVLEGLRTRWNHRARDGWSRNESISFTGITLSRCDVGRVCIDGKIRHDDPPLPLASAPPARVDPLFLSGFRGAGVTLVRPVHVFPRSDTPALGFFQAWPWMHASLPAFLSDVCLRPIDLMTIMHRLVPIERLLLRETNLLRRSHTASTHSKVGATAQPTLSCTCHGSLAGPVMYSQPLTS